MTKKELKKMPQNNTLPPSTPAALAVAMSKAPKQTKPASAAMEHVGFRDRELATELTRLADLLGISKTTLVARAVRLGLKPAVRAIQAEQRRVYESRAVEPILEAVERMAHSKRGVSARR